MKSKAFVQSWAIVIVVLCVPLMYVSGYLTIVTPVEFRRHDDSIARLPMYQIADERMQVAFWPAHWVDRTLVRQAYWADRFD